jgi:hypothetical protein
MQVADRRLQTQKLIEQKEKVERDMEQQFQKLDGIVAPRKN